MSQRFDPPTSFAVFGGAAMDHVASTVHAPVLHASNPGVSHSAPGGVALNVARGLARLGQAVRLVTRLGDDPDGAALLAAARRDRIDIAWTAAVPSRRTATYRAAFDHAGDLIIGIADMDVLDALTPEAVVDALAAAPPAEAFVIDANLPEDTLAFIAGRGARGRNLVAAIGVSPAKAVRLVPALDGIALLFATRREAAAMLGEDEDAPVPTAKLAAKLAGLGAAQVVVTDSAGPLAAAAGGNVRLLAPFPAEVRSVNGAGDALAAGTLHGLATGHGFLAAVRHGLAAAAITVEDPETVAAGLDRDALEARIAAGG